MGRSLLLALSLHLAAAAGCNDATETNVMPAPCTTDEDCPRGIRCGAPEGAPPDGGLRVCLLRE